MPNFDLKDVFTISTATVGAVLGVINTWHSLNEKQVKLRVTPKYAEFRGDGVLQCSLPLGRIGNPTREMGCIEVINLSAFPVGISEIGFTILGYPRKGTRMSIVQPITTDGKRFGRRLESRESVEGYFELSTLRQDVKQAYAMTDCGEVVYGTSPALKEIVSRIY